MQLNDIYWHDSTILEVKIKPQESCIEMKLLYPDDWESNTFNERTVIFEEAHGYKDFQGPFSGSPTILAVDAVGEKGGWVQLKIETNASYCELYCANVYLK